MAFSFPFASIDSDRQITSEQERARIKSIADDGVKNPFVGSVVNNVLTVTAGSAVVGGAFYSVDTGDSVQLPASGTKCYINLRLDTTQRKVYLMATTDATLSATAALTDLRLGECSYAGTAWGDVTWTQYFDRFGEIETYVNGVRTVKHANGRMEMYGSAIQSVECIYDQTGGQYGSVELNIYLPTKFVAVDFATVELIPRANRTIKAYMTNYTANSLTYRGVTPGSATIQCTVKWCAVGTWK